MLLSLVLNQSAEVTLEVEFFRCGDTVEDSLVNFPTLDAPVAHVDTSNVSGPVTLVPLQGLQTCVNQFHQVA